MHAKIRIEIEDGTVLEGTANFQKKSSGTAQVKPVIVQKPKLGRKSDLQSCIQDLKEQGFFDETPVVTTPELLKALYLKCNKKIPANNATRDLGKLVVQGVLRRDELSPRQDIPKGIQIWYLPDTDKKIIEKYKKDNGGNQK